MPPPTHEVYRVVTKLHGVSSLWTFRIFDDDTLQVEIERDGNAPTPLAGPRPEPRSPSASYVYGHYVAFCCVNNRAISSEDMCEWQFYVANGNESPGKKVVCSLSPARGIVCVPDARNRRRYSMIRSSIFTAALNHPVEWSVATEPVRATLYPLTSGSYTLQGALQPLDIGRYYVRPITLHIELLPGGRVAGTGYDSGYDDYANAVPLGGSWTTESLEVFQNYTVWPQYPLKRLCIRGRVSQYAFGPDWTWEAEKPLSEDDEDENPRNKHEGCADFSVTSMQRRWRPEDHRFFPEQFREAVRWCLLSSLRRETSDASGTPHYLWPSVFAFCDFH